MDDVKNRAVHVNAWRRLLNVRESQVAFRCRNPFEVFRRRPWPMTAGREDAVVSLVEYFRYRLTRTIQSNEHT